jgi:CheY-like chemotaxis protein
MKNGKKPPVLVVDDNDEICAALRWMLEDDGYEVLWTSDGAAALNILRSAEDRFVVLLDYVMPEVTGQDVLESVVADPRLSTSHVFILMTAMARTLPPKMLRLLTTLGIPVIQKPFDIDDLAAQVSQAAGRLHALPGRKKSGSRLPTPRQ